MIIILSGIQYKIHMNELELLQLAGEMATTVVNYIKWYNKNK